MAARVDFGKFRLVVPIRLAFCVVLPLAIGLVADRIALGVAASMGAFICGIADAGDSYPVRARVMTIASVALAFTTLVGGLVSQSVPLTIAVSVPIAFVCGYVAVFGPNALLTGTLALVMYTLYAGGPVGEEAAISQAVAVLAGALFQTALAVSGWPFKRCSGVRGQLADTWRTYYALSNGKPKDLLSPELPGQIVHTATEIGWSGTTGPTLDWLHALLAAAEGLRLPMASIAARRMTLVEGGVVADELTDLDAFSQAVAQFSRAVSRALVLPVRRRAVAPSLDHLQTKAMAARQWAPAQVDAILISCSQAAAQLDRPFPIGTRGSVRPAFNIASMHPKEAIRRSWNLESPIMRHSIRLAVTIPIAWVVGELLLTEHQYWVALTVAWVTRPGYGITFGRVVSRTVGTLIGLILIGVVIYLLLPGPWGMVVICGISAYVMYASLPVNYTFSVVFITALIVTLLALDGDRLLASLLNRGAGTVLGGIVALIGSQVGASWAAPTLAVKLADVAQCTQRYANAIFAHADDVTAATGALINSRREAAAAIEESRLEPANGKIPPARAERVLSAVLTSIFLVASADPHGTQRDSSLQIDFDRLDAELSELEEQLLAINDGSVAISPGPLPQVPITDPTAGSGLDPACQAVNRAIAYL